LTAGPYDYQFPSFSSTDQWIICSRTEDSTAQICVVPAGGGSSTDITTSPTLKCYPEWSPDDQWAAYEEQSSTDGGDEQSHVVRVKVDLTGILNPEAQVALPLKFDLLPPTPNPAPGKVKLRYTIPRTTGLTLGVYDIAGRELARLISNQRTNPGVYTQTWNCLDGRGRPIGNGIYFLRLFTGIDCIERKLAVVR